MDARRLRGVVQVRALADPRLVGLVLLLPLGNHLLEELLRQPRLDLEPVLADVVADDGST